MEISMKSHSIDHFHLKEVRVSYKFFINYTFHEFFSLFLRVKGRMKKEEEY